MEDTQPSRRRADNSFQRAIGSNRRRAVRVRKKQLSSFASGVLLPYCRSLVTSNSVA